MRRTLIAVLFASCIASSAFAQIRLEDLLTGHDIQKKARFDVADITVGDTSVAKLFLPFRSRAPFRTRLMGGQDHVVLKLRDKAALAALRTLLLEQQKPLLQLHLADRGPMPRLARALRSVATLDAARTMELPLTIEITPCQRVTRIVYKSIDSILRRELERAGQTRRPVTLDAVFNLLLKEQIEPFLKSLEPSDQGDPCFTTFTLLKWLRNQEAHGFEFARYKLNHDMQDVLSAVASASSTVQTSRHYALQVEVTGYTDSHAFEKHLPVKAASTGVAVARDPLRIAHRGCSNDRMYADTQYFLDLDGADGTMVGENIDDNCELGAVRAWVAAAFLRQHLGTARVVYRYATGGIAGGPRGTDKDALRRKVGIRITVRTANEE